MDFSDCDILAIHPPDDLGPQSDTEVRPDESRAEILIEALSDDLDESYVEESFVEEVKFERLLPTFYTHVYFHIGRVIRYADHDKDEWYWAVVSDTGDVSNDGSFDMYLRLCGDINPADNGVCIRFPDEFYEIYIDDDSYQYQVTNIHQLSKGDHIRFYITKKGQWLMGWITNVLRTFMYVRLTCENNRNQLDRFNFKSLSRISRVPMIPVDIIDTI